MIIDNKGKLFGKINVIDLLIVVVIVAAVALIAFKTVIPDGGTETTQSGEVVKQEDVDVFFEFYAEEVPEYVVDGTMKKGDKVTEVGTDNLMGEIVDFEIKDSVAYASDDEGKWVASPKPNYKSVRVRCKGKGDYYEHGCKIKGAKYYVGHTMTIAAGRAKLYLKISDIEYVDQELK